MGTSYINIQVPRSRDACTESGREHNLMAVYECTRRWRTAHNDHE
ncbi:hypothetical protein WUBG_04709 [Wuchereria bancrofti]|uniref:Uncharacterized protein n=1 Tax=Wuchereria bancrofti TaxID=6293 RepID=J9EPB9_WUCBA|nr:hypothetical protein WUBG_04709 [Wuchereria bancrofti]